MRAAIYKNNLSKAIEALKKFRRRTREVAIVKTDQSNTYEEYGSNYFLVGGPYPNYTKK